MSSLLTGLFRNPLAANGSRFFFLSFPQLPSSKLCPSRCSDVITMDRIITSHYVITQRGHCKDDKCLTLQLGRCMRKSHNRHIPEVTARLPPASPHTISSSMFVALLSDTQLLLDYGVPGFLKWRSSCLKRSIQLPVFLLAHLLTVQNIYRKAQFQRNLTKGHYESWE